MKGTHSQSTVASIIRGYIIKQWECEQELLNRNPDVSVRIPGVLATLEEALPVFSVGCLQQNNSYDCGFIALQYIEYIIASSRIPDSDNIIPSTQPEKQLYTSLPPYVDWFERSDIDHQRRYIEALCNLMRENPTMIDRLSSPCSSDDPSEVDIETAVYESVRLIPELTMKIVFADPRFLQSTYTQSNVNMDNNMDTVMKYLSVRCSSLSVTESLKNSANDPFLASIVNPSGIDFSLSINLFLGTPSIWRAYLMDNFPTILRNEKVFSSFLAGTPLGVGRSMDDFIKLSRSIFLPKEWADDSTELFYALLLPDVEITIIKEKTKFSPVRTVLKYNEPDTNNASSKPVRARITLLLEGGHYFSLVPHNSFLAIPTLDPFSYEDITYHKEDVPRDGKCLHDVILYALRYTLPDYRFPVSVDFIVQRLPNLLQNMFTDNIFSPPALEDPLLCLDSTAIDALIELFSDVPNAKVIGKWKTMKTKICQVRSLMNTVQNVQVNKLCTDRTIIVNTLLNYFVGVTMIRPKK